MWVNVYFFPHRYILCVNIHHWHWEENKRDYSNKMQEQTAKWNCSVQTLITPTPKQNLGSESHTLLFLNTCSNLGQHRIQGLFKQELYLESKLMHHLYFYITHFWCLGDVFNLTEDVTVAFYLPMKLHWGE